MGYCLCLADMLYPAVISLAVAPQQSRFRFLQHSKFIKYVQLKKMYLINIKEENAPTKTVFKLHCEVFVPLLITHNYWRLLIAYSSLSTFLILK
ncbi:hypothetical protein SAMN05216524_104482 [Mucilaginibacter sp. OK098]|nr:hypothetical protein SAMN05216524_104482 [Mucilaginibacter sp. OK098]